MAISMGVVTKRSTSSALLPCHWETRMTCVLVTSGKASTGIFRKLYIPARAMSPTQKKVKKRCRREKPMIDFMNLLIFTAMHFDPKQEGTAEPSGLHRRAGGVRKSPSPLRVVPRRPEHANRIRIPDELL